jgi:hypothetical protein
MFVREVPPANNSSLPTRERLLPLARLNGGLSFGELLSVLLPMVGAPAPPLANHRRQGRCPLLPQPSRGPLSRDRKNFRKQLPQIENSRIEIGVLRIVTCRCHGRISLAGPGDELGPGEGVGRGRELFAETDGAVIALPFFRGSAPNHSPPREGRLPLCGQGRVAACRSGHAKGVHSLLGNEETHQTIFGLGIHLNETAGLKRP